MPGRQLGAPQTTVFVPYRPASTTAMTLWLPAIGSTLTTRAATTRARCAPTSWTPSHSAVFIVISRPSSAGAASTPSTSSQSQL